MTQYAFYFDSNSCVGCKACQVSCKETYKLPVDVLWRRVYEYQGGSWDYDEAEGLYRQNNVFGYFTSIACNHCSNPACVNNCPTGAMQKDEETGIVWTDHETCIGCKTCETVCPYGAPSFDEAAGYMTKCDMCKDEIDADRKPVCVRACPMRVLDCGPLDEIVAKYGEGDVEMEPLPPDTTDPSLILNPHRNAQKTNQGSGSIANLAEEV